MIKCHIGTEIFFPNIFKISSLAEDKLRLGPQTQHVVSAGRNFFLFLQEILQCLGPKNNTSVSDYMGSQNRVIFFKAIFLCGF